MTPHLLKCCATSVSVASGGNPVTYTLVFCFNWNQDSCDRQQWPLITFGCNYQRPLRHSSSNGPVGILRNITHCAGLPSGAAISCKSLVRDLGSECLVKETCRHYNDEEMKAADLAVCSLFGPFLLPALPLKGFRQLPLVGAWPLRSARITGIVVLVCLVVLEVLSRSSFACDEHLICSNRVASLRELAARASSAKHHRFYAPSVRARTGSSLRSCGQPGPRRAPLCSASRG